MGHPDSDQRSKHLTDNKTLIIAESYCLQSKTDFNGSDVAMVNFVPSASHCQFECQKNDACRFFTFNSGGKCFLKTNNVAGANNIAISGPKFCMSTKGKLLSFHTFFANFAKKIIYKTA